MKDDGLAAMGGDIRLVELRQRQVVAAGDAFARPFVGLAHVDQHGAVGDEAPGFLRGDGFQASFAGSSLLAVGGGLAEQRDAG